MLSHQTTFTSSMSTNTSITPSSIWSMTSMKGAFPPTPKPHTQHCKSIFGKQKSNIRICTTNIRGMKIGTDREEHKLCTIINTSSDILILIDHHLDQQKLASLIKNNRQVLSKFTIYGTPSLKRGILVLVKKSCGCKIINIKNSWENNIMAFDIILPDM